MCYWLITETSYLVSKTSVEHVMRDDKLKPYIKSRIDDFNRKLTEWLDNRSFQVNVDVDCKFEFTLPGKDFCENQSFTCDIVVTPTD